jgi:hypothetical protein
MEWLMPKITLSCAATVMVFASLGSFAADSGSAPVPPASWVRAIKVQPDKAPDCSSLKTIAETVTRECKTNDEKAIAIYNFMQ